MKIASKGVLLWAMKRSGPPERWGQRFTSVVIGLAVVVGFLVVFLSMYTAVLERTREIGILKALGASPGYIMTILLRETFLLAWWAPSLES
jgi:ABC-type antimicrobial peptide transport system permease subunit